MTECLLYQTVEDRNNPDEILEKGPFKCERKDAWLGSGYYFWEGEIGFAKKWGKNARYEKFVICESAFDYDDHCFFDIVGNPSHLKTMREITELLEKKVFKDKDITITVPMVIEILRNEMAEDFHYKSIRSRSEWKEWRFLLPFSARRPDKEQCNLCPEIQHCVIDLTFLIKDYRIVYPEKYRKKSPSV